MHRAKRRSSCWFVPSPHRTPPSTPTIPRSDQIASCAPHPQFFSCILSAPPHPLSNSLRFCLFSLCHPLSLFSLSPRHLPSMTPAHPTGEGDRIPAGSGPGVHAQHRQHGSRQSLQTDVTLSEPRARRTRVWHPGHSKVRPPVLASYFRRRAHLCSDSGVASDCTRGVSACLSTPTPWHSSLCPMPTSELSILHAIHALFTLCTPRYPRHCAT